MILAAHRARGSPPIQLVFARWGLLVACAIWLMAFVVTLSLLLAGRLEAIPYGVYAAAGARWLAHAPLYETRTIDGFQYFPQSALLFSPFAWLGSPLGDTTWRALGWSLYALGVWRLARLLAPTQAATCFLVATCLSVGAATGSLGNGQANLMVGALTVHVAADLIERRWWRATWILALGFALKPLVIVWLGLIWALYRPMTWRIPVAVGVMVALPWLLRPHAYVMAQYRDCWTKLGMCATPDRLFEDLRGLLATVGWLMPHSIYLLVRAGAALGVLGIALRAKQRLSEPNRSLSIAALAASYLMLFNPRTLSTSYVIPAAWCGLLAGMYIVQQRRREAAVMALILSSWTISYHEFGFVVHWLRPVGCIAFGVMLLREVFGFAVRPNSRGLDGVVS